jgi:hypothetical protein
MPSTKIWNSAIVQQSLEKLKLGIFADLSCFYHGDIELKAGELLYQLDSDEIDEFHKCSNDIIYFVEKYCRFLTDSGRRTVELRKYQKKILKYLAEEGYSEKLQELIPKVRNLIMMQSRQSGKTTTVAAYFSWYLCFHSDRNLAILANKQDTAFEIVSKVKDVFKGLPFFLKPGIIQVGAGGMVLDNGCKLLSQATTKTAQIGYTIHVLYADEFAHIQSGIADDFWRSVYPTLSAGEVSQCIISSTPNGEDNVFFEIWDKSQKGLNSFVPIRVDWWEVPGHDDEWAEKMKKDFGEDRFSQEFGLDFNRGGSNLLLSGADLAFITRLQKEYVFQELMNTELEETQYRNLRWHPDFDPNKKFNTKNDRFIISIDTGEGKDEEETKDNDYNICNIFHVQPKSIAQLKRLRNDEMKIENMFRAFQVGLYRDNIKDEENCANVTKSVIFDQIGSQFCKLLVEMNFNGKFFLDKFSQHDDFDDSIILHTYHTKPVLGEKPPRKKAGFKVTGGDKDLFCKLGKKMVNNRLLVINEFETIKEFKAFGKNKHGKWKGLGVHDDIAMSTINISRLYNESEYAEWLYDYLEELEDSPAKTLMNKLLEKYEETTEVEDNLFKAMYDESQKELTESAILKMLNNKPNEIRYKPSSTFSKSIYAFPWRKS